MYLNNNFLYPDGFVGPLLQNDGNNDLNYFQHYWSQKYDKITKLLHMCFFQRNGKTVKDLTKIDWIKSGSLLKDVMCAVSRNWKNDNYLNR